MLAALKYLPVKNHCHLANQKANAADPLALTDTLYLVNLAQKPRCLKPLILDNDY